MFFLVFYAISMPVTGILLQKQKHSKVILVGGILVGAGWMTASFSNDILTMVITLGFLAGIGVGAVYGAVISSISNWFPDKKGLATGLTLSGFGLSPFVTAPLARFIIESSGVMQTLRFLGIIFLVIIISSAFMFRSPLIVFEKKGIKKQHAQDMSAKEMMRSRNFFALWVCFGLGTFNGLMTVNISGPVGQELFALDDTFTALMVSTFAVFNCIGRPLFGWLTDWLKPKKAAQILFSIIFLASAAVVLVEAKTLVLYIISFSMLWLALGGWLAVAPASTAILFGNKHHSKNYGIVFTAYGVGAIMGVLISGLIRDTTGSYHLVFYPMMISAVLGLIFSVFIGVKPGYDIEGKMPIKRK